MVWATAKNTIPLLIAGVQIAQHQERPICGARGDRRAALKKWRLGLTLGKVTGQ
jgi:hypothetical protein